jgi:hypothetical protein
MAAQTDLWGEISELAVRTPVAILREQAALLGTKTKNLVEARVTTEPHGNAFLHRFDLVAPPLDNYTYNLFNVRHGIDFYPIQVWGEEKKLDSEEEFLNWLGEKLSAESTKRVIRNLVAQMSE